MGGLISGTLREFQPTNFGCESKVSIHHQKRGGEIDMGYIFSRPIYTSILNFRSTYIVSFRKYLKICWQLGSQTSPYGASLAQEANVGNRQSKEQASQLLREASADVQRQVLTRGGLRPLDFKSGGLFLNKLDVFFFK